MTRTPVLVLLGCLLSLAGCMGDSNVPGLTKDPEAAAEAAFPALPDGNEGPELIERGYKMFKGLGCEQCHSTNTARKGLQGPPLGGLSDRVIDNHDGDPLQARRWTVRHIKDPQQYPGDYAGHEDYKGSFMTPYNRVADDDMRALVEYLFSLR